MKIYEFQKNAQEKVILEFTEFKGKQLIDLRVYYDAGKTEEDWRPTRKGVSIRLEALQDLKEGIDKASKLMLGERNETNRNNRG